MVTAPLSLFDSLEFIKSQKPPPYLSQSQKNDFDISKAFLKSYIGSIETFNSYRREIERLLQWCFNIANKSLKQLKRDDIKTFIRFCQKPKKSWIGVKKVHKFIEQESSRIQNQAWHPFWAAYAVVSRYLVF